MKKKILLVLVALMFIFVTPVLASSGQDVPSVEITAAWLATAAGVLLSLGFSYIPNVNTWYAALDSTRKRLLMAGLLAILAIGVYVLGCFDILSVNVECTTSGMWSVVMIYIEAVIANQATFMISPQTNAVKSAKSA